MKAFSQQGTEAARKGTAGTRADQELSAEGWWGCGRRHSWREAFQLVGRCAGHGARRDERGKRRVVAVAAADAEDVPSSIVGCVGGGRLLRVDRGGSSCSWVRTRPAPTFPYEPRPMHKHDHTFPRAPPAAFPRPPMFAASIFAVGHSTDQSIFPYSAGGDHMRIQSDYGAS